MNDKELTSILDRCLEQIAAGETVSACLAGYPEHAAELAPLLAMACELEALGSRTARSPHRAVVAARFTLSAAHSRRIGCGPILRYPDDRSGGGQPTRRPGLRGACGSRTGARVTYGRGKRARAG